MKMPSALDSAAKFSGMHSSNASASSSANIMPAPGDIHNPGWSKLPAPLNDAVLSRFDQNRCTNNHGINPRVMCFGLSLSWVENVNRAGNAATHYASSDRMNKLASFEGVVNARIMHNFYRHEHAFQLKAATESGELGKALMAGTTSMLEAAEYKNIKLKPLLSEPANSDIPFLIIKNISGDNVVDDDDAYAKFGDALPQVAHGIITMYGNSGSHALGFSATRDGRYLVFDPNQGEFHIDPGNMKQTINKLSECDGVKMVGIQIFKAD